MNTPLLTCPKDFNLGDMRDDHCNVGGIPCPEPVAADPEAVVSVACGPCGRQWGIPIVAIMKGKAQNFHQCVRSECAAKIMVPAPPAPVVVVSTAFDPDGPTSGSTGHAPAGQSKTTKKK